MAERVENNRTSRIIVPKQDLLLELTENLNILSGRQGICVFSRTHSDSDISQVQKQLRVSLSIICYIKKILYRSFVV